MSNLVGEFLLRLAKAGAALVLGAILDWVLVSFTGATATVELALLCWLAAAAFILLVEESPI
jgi:cell shape-determining protein MreD